MSSFLIFGENLSAENLLEAKGITMQFGGLKAVSSLDLTIKKGQLAGLIGPNGAGKTTVFNMLTGVYQPTSGQVLLEGKLLNGKKPFEISHMGVTRTFQNIRLFKGMTVIENVLIAYHQNMTYGLLDSVLKTEKFLKQEQEAYDKAMSLLAIFKLDKKAHEESASLPYGEQSSAN